MALLLIVGAAAILTAQAFAPPIHIQAQRRTSSHGLALASSDGEWNGEVVSNGDTRDGRIKGCQLKRVNESLTDWIVRIDGEEADLGKFSEAVFRKISSEAKQQRFQGFRPGTIPPHLMSTYTAFAMDEVAREATLEAMEQNNIRPFESNRSEISFDTISIPPSKKKKKKKKAKKKMKKEDAPITSIEPEVETWLTFETMKEAINAGWKPGQSFSFVARNVKGQQLKDQSDVTGAAPIGEGYRPGTSVNWNAIDVASQSSTD